MMFWPVQTSIVEVLSESVKEEIARRVAEPIYRELRTGRYLQDAYINEVAIEIASKSFEIEAIRNPENDVVGFRVKGAKR